MPAALRTPTRRAIALLRYAANKAWISGYAREHARFVSSLDRVEKTQSALLLQLLSSNAQTRFGTGHSFSRLRSVEDFQAAVPLSNYETTSTDIETIARGEPNILTRERVLRFQPTSGSIGSRKYIPWTRTLAVQFLRGIAPWLHQLYTSNPSLFGGSAYWSISPHTEGGAYKGCIPVGFESDATYLGFLGRQFYNLVSAVPSQVAQTRDMEAFKDKTMAALLANEDLGLISIWSPSFLTLLIEHFLRQPNRILELVSHSSGARVKQLRPHLESPACPEEWTRRVWPRLKLISCWTSGPSEQQAKRLRSIFPGVEVQGKGLLATEAFVTLPFSQTHDPVLAVRSHFFEFQDPVTGKVHLSHALSPKTRYRVIVTTAGGLYRYCLGDLVEVTGYLGEAPCMTFLGREGGISDQVGEKLNAYFVQQTVQQCLCETGISSAFYLVAPAHAEAGLSYVLFIKPDGPGPLSLLRDKVEDGLRHNFHYDHCRRLGQLASLRLFAITQEHPSPETIYTERLSARGIKLGDIKASPLDNQPGWETKFQGRFDPADE